MEHHKISKLLDDSTVSKFVTYGDAHVFCEMGNNCWKKIKS